MAKRFTMVSASIWDSEKFAKLKNSDARLLYIYLLTCPLSNIIGCFIFKPGYARADLPYLKDPEKLLNELEAAGLIKTSGATIRITNFSRHSPISSWQHAIAAITDCLAVPDAEMRRDIAAEITETAGYEALTTWRNAKKEPHNALVKIHDLLRK